MNLQRTLERPVTIEGLGLFSGCPCSMRLLPAETNAGITFLRKDNAGGCTEIPCNVANVANVANQPRRSSLAGGEVTVETVEHVLSAVAGMGIDNIIIEMDAAETPSTDGSAVPFVQAIEKAGIKQQSEARRGFVIDRPISVDNGSASLEALPGPDDRLEILYELNYPQTPAIGRQVLSFSLGQDDYAATIAPARTFLLEQEAKLIQASGYGLHLSAKDILVIGPNGVIDNTLRFDDEPVRHKIMDLIGDLTLVGRPLAGRVVAIMSGHELNHSLARKLQKAIGL